MYRYKYTAAVNADKQAFYDAAEEICKAYPYYKELPDNGVYNDTMKKYFSVTEQGEHKEVCVMLEKDCGRLTVSSDKYLRTYFKGKKVERIILANARTMWAVSGIYFALMALLVFICAMGGFIFLFRYLYLYCCAFSCLRWQ